MALRDRPMVIAVSKLTWDGLTAADRDIVDGDRRLAEGGHAQGARGGD